MKRKPTVAPTVTPTVELAPYEIVLLQRIRHYRTRHRGQLHVFIGPALLHATMLQTIDADAPRTTCHIPTREPIIPAERALARRGAKTQ